MIDLETVQSTKGGDRFDRLTALLIGCIAVMAAALVVIQTAESLAEARANAGARRLASELTTRIIASGSLANHQGVNSQRALLVGMEGTSRILVGLQAEDAGEISLGTAQSAAGERLLGIALTMGARPDADSPLDPYARAVLATVTDDMLAMLEEQNRQADLADAASTRSTFAVLGLSVVALAGVLVGLAAVVGNGRAGRALLLLAWIAGAGAVLLLLQAAQVLPAGILPAGVLPG